MQKDLYTVKIPVVLTNLVGKQNIREKIQGAVEEIFTVWAHPELVKGIQVTKPRGKKGGEESG